MQALEDAARENGIDVPLTHNAPNMVCNKLVFSYAFFE